MISPEQGTISYFKGKLEEAQSEIRYLQILVYLQKRLILQASLHSSPSKVAKLLDRVSNIDSVLKDNK